jgi:hypothetical protein
MVVEVSRFSLISPNKSYHYVRAKLALLEPKVRAIRANRLCHVRKETGRLLKTGNEKYLGRIGELALTVLTALTFASGPFPVGRRGYAPFPDGALGALGGPSFAISSHRKNTEKNRDLPHREKRGKNGTQVRGASAGREGE